MPRGRTTTGDKAGKEKDTRTHINFPIDSENYEYLRTMSHMMRQSMANYLNFVLKEYREEPDHAEDYRKACALSDSLMKKAGLDGGKK